jgi:hypothetical protein
LQLFWIVGSATTVVSLLAMVIGAVVTVGTFALGRRRSRSTLLGMRLLLCGPGGASCGMAIAMLGLDLPFAERMIISVGMAAFGIVLLVFGIRARLTL